MRRKVAYNHLLDEIFLPYMVNNAGRTLFEAYRENAGLLEAGTFTSA